MKIHMKYILLAGVAMAALILFVMIINTFLVRSRAGSATVSYSFTPQTIAIDEKGASVSLLLKTDDSTHKISGFDVRPVIEGPVVIESTETPTSYPDATKNTFTELIKKATRLSYVIFAGDEVLPDIVSIPFTLQCSGVGEGSLSIDTQASQIVGNIEGSVYSPGTMQEVKIECKEAGSITPTTHPSVTPMPSRDCTTDSDCPSNLPVCSPSGVCMEVMITPTPKQEVTEYPVRAYFIPPTRTIGVGKEATYYFALQPSASEGVVHGISGFDVKLKYDPQVIKVEQVLEPADLMEEATAAEINSASSIESFYTPSSKFSKLQNNIDTTRGTISLSYVSIVSDDQLPKWPVVKIVAKGASEGNGEFAFTAIQVVGNIEGSEYKAYTYPGLYTVQKIVEEKDPTPTINPNITPIPTGEGGVVLNMTLRLQGVLQRPSTQSEIPVRVTVADGGLTTPYVTKGIFKADDAGLWRASVPVAVPAGSGYKLLIKGPLHIQKKVCSASATESYPGTYACDKGAIQLTQGENIIDLSGIYMMAGDLPKQGGAQDGIVNSYDTSLVHQLLGRTDAEALSLADLNMDGAVKAQDYSIIIEALSIRADEQ